MAIGDATKLSSVSDKRSVKQTIPITHRDEPSLPQLRVFDVLLREHSLTHAARELGIPAAAREPVLPGGSGHTRRRFGLWVGRRRPSIWSPCPLARTARLVAGQGEASRRRAISCLRRVARLGAKFAEVSVASLLNELEQARAQATTLGPCAGRSSCRSPPRGRCVPPWPGSRVLRTARCARSQI